MKSSPKYVALLVLVALIWGCGFVAQSVGVESVAPLTFNSARMFISSIALLPVIFLIDRIDPKPVSQRTPERRNTLWRGGIACGLLLGAASAAQQIGIQYAAAGKAGFITAMYIILVPILGILFGKFPPLRVWIAVFIAVGGLYLLCYHSNAPLDRGDLPLLFCSVLFSLHILAVDYFVVQIEGVKLACIQFFIAGVLCAVGALFFETIDLWALLAAWKPVLYAGLISGGMGYTLQIIAQKRVEPTLASITMSLESVFSVLAGFVFLQEILSLREVCGCILLFIAIILAQLKPREPLL